MPQLICVLAMCHNQYPMSASHSTTRHLWRCDLIRGNVMFDLGFRWSRNWNEPCYIFDGSNCTLVCFSASIRACSVFCGICDFCLSTRWCGVYAVFVFVWRLFPVVFVAFLECVSGVVCV